MSYEEHAKRINVLLKALKEAQGQTWKTDPIYKELRDLGVNEDDAHRYMKTVDK